VGRETLCKISGGIMTENFLTTINEGDYVWTKSPTLQTRHLRKVVRLTDSFFIVAGAHEGYQERSTTERYARIDGLQIGSWRSFREHIDGIAAASEIKAQLAKKQAEETERKLRATEKENREALKVQLTAGFKNENIHVDSFNEKDETYIVTISNLTEAQVIHLQEVLLQWSSNQ
jgi:hypothetical protein